MRSVAQCIRAIVVLSVSAEREKFACWRRNETSAELLPVVSLCSGGLLRSIRLGGIACCLVEKED